MNESLPERHCKSCGNRFTGSYCNLCGEKVLLAEDRSFKTFLSGILLAVTFADNKVIKTLWLVIRKPGFISREFSEGRHIHYLKPLSLFFVLNLIYFLFPVIQLFNASLKTQLNAPFGVLINGPAARAMAHMNINSIDSFSLIYNQKTQGLAKLLVMVFVVLGSLPLNLLYRKKSRYFADHVGFMVELACFNLFLNTLFLTLVTHLFGLGQYLNESSLTVIFVVTNLYFLISSGIVFYEEKGWRLILKSVIMLLVLKIALDVYRVILFFITLWAL